MEKLFEIIENSGEISTQGYKITLEDKDFTIIEVSPKDKYGQAMIAYFYNMLRGQNKNGLASKDTPLLYYDPKKESYILKLTVHPTVDCLCKNYENFRANYQTLIQDEISDLSKALKRA